MENINDPFLFLFIYTFFNKRTGYDYMLIFISVHISLDSGYALEKHLGDMAVECCF